MGLMTEIPESLPNALTSTHLVFATEKRSVLVDRTAQGMAIQSRTPAVLKAKHDPASPLILDGQRPRDIVRTHQQDFKLATASLTSCARYFRANASVVHARHCPTFWHYSAALRGRRLRVAGFRVFLATASSATV